MEDDVAELGFARVDLSRQRRQGFPEIIYGAGKTPEQVVAIGRVLVERNGFCLATRVGEEHASVFLAALPEGQWHREARCLQWGGLPRRGVAVAVLAAGTSDLPVAEEAAVSLEALGFGVERYYDVGVAGLHRLVNQLDSIEQAAALVVVAGMEAALPSVVGGLLPHPIVAVPTSVGYGAHFQGLASLLGMLNSCASGITVVNIDNGFGAACALSRMFPLKS